MQRVRGRFHGAPPRSFLEREEELEVGCVSKLQEDLLSPVKAGEDFDILEAVFHRAYQQKHSSKLYDTYSLYM